MREGLLGPSSFWWPNCFILNKDYGRGRRAGSKDPNCHLTPVCCRSPPTRHCSHFYSLLLLRHHHYLPTSHKASPTRHCCHIFQTQPFSSELFFSHQSHFVFVSLIYCILFIMYTHKPSLSKSLERLSSEFPSSEKSNLPLNFFSCPADSSIGDLVTDSLTDPLTHSLTDVYFCHTKSNPRDLLPLRHLIRVMRRHDLTHFWPSFLSSFFRPPFWPSFLTRQYWRLDIWDTDYNSENWEPEFRQSFLPDN